MGRNKLPENLKAHNWTIKVYEWEKSDIKKYINEKLRGKIMNKKSIEPSEEMKKRYEEVFNYDPTDEEVDSHYDDEFNKWLEEETFE